MELYSKYSFVIGERYTKSACKWSGQLHKSGKIWLKVKKDNPEGQAGEIYSRRKIVFPLIYF